MASGENGFRTHFVASDCVQVDNRATCLKAHLKIRNIHFYASLIHVQHSTVPRRQDVDVWVAVSPAVASSFSKGVITHTDRE